MLHSFHFGLVGLGVLGLIIAAASNPLPQPDLSLNPRQYQIYDPAEQCCKTNCHLENVGNGDMHIDWLHTQLTDAHGCTDGTCGASFTTGLSVSWTVNANINVGFFSGGFAVSETYTTSETYECQAAPGQKVSIWSRVAHAAYTVQPNPNYPPICDWDGNTIVRSPLKDQPDTVYYCVRETSRSLGDFYWCLGQEDMSEYGIDHYQCPFEI